MNDDQVRELLRIQEHTGRSVDDCYKMWINMADGFSDEDITAAENALVRKGIIPGKSVVHM